MRSPALTLSQPRLFFILKTTARIFAVLVASLSSLLRAEPSFSKQILWDKNEGGYVSHFVYGIGITWDDTVLVSCEGRVGGADAGEKDLLLKRSSDGGTTWSKEQVIEGADDALSWSNPSFVTDGLTTYLFYAQSVSSDIGRVFFRTSTDNGTTWSERTEITSLWAGNPHDWTQRSSIGHGIKKLKPPHRGRVLLAFHHRGRVDLPPVQRGYGNDVIHLTPDGWRIAGGPPLEPGRGTNEARLAERPDGSLYLMARQAVGNNQVRARSDGDASGAHWSPWTSQEDLRGTVCDGSLLRFSDTLHLYSFPASEARSAQKRSDLSIAISSDGGRSWGGPKLVHAGQATYSDLARDSVGNIYCLYGGDGSDFMGDRVYLAKFNAEWLTGSPVPTIVVDDQEKFFATTGEWKSAPRPGAYKGSHHRSAVASARAEWKPAIGVSGTYEFFIRWPAETANTAAAVVTITVDGRSVHTETIDQRTEGATWHYLATAALTDQSDCRITLRGEAPGAIAADAVMLQMQ